VASDELERLAEALQAGRVGAPVSVSAMDALGLRGVAARAEAFAGLDREATLAVIEVALDERRAPRPTLDLVWSGPEGKTGWAAPTAKVLTDLFERAERSVLLAGYSFDHGATILEPLHAVMVARKVTVDVFLHVATAPRGTKDVDAYVANEVARFLSVQWAWPEKPRVYVDPRTATPAGHGQHASMHAKCVVVDEKWSLVGSANFTSRGQERNIEVGALIDDAAFARAVVSQFRSAIAVGVFRA
jgi:phosphatidylserine/phosphatidylglycerophosphate/cardiolipin synthase-like enzyme